MIVGLGVDIVDVARVERICESFGERLAHRVLAAEEFEDYRASSCPARFLARRFAVKEACAKALGTGFQQGVRFRDIGLAHDELGAPKLELAGGASSRLKDIGGRDALVSLSDEHSNVVAVVVLVRAATDAF